MSARAPIEDVVRVLREDGGVIVKDLIDARTVAAINAEVDGYIEAANPAMRHLNTAIQVPWWRRPSRRTQALAEEREHPLERGARRVAVDVDEIGGHD